MTPVKKTYSGIELLCFYATFRHSALTFSYIVTNITQKYEQDERFIWFELFFLHSHLPTLHTNILQLK